jgi:hypothetical protein
VVGAHDVCLCAKRTDGREAVECRTDVRQHRTACCTHDETTCDGIV